MSVARTWAAYVSCPTCAAEENEACKKADGAKGAGTSYRGLYMHRARVTEAVHAALEVACPKCGRPKTIPCFFRTEVLAEVDGAAVVAVGSKNKVCPERAKAARKQRREERRMSLKREAEAVVSAVRNSDWTQVEGGAWAASAPFTLLRPDPNSHGHSAVYAIHDSGRLFRSVTKGSNSLTSCSLGQAVHRKWISEIAADIPGGTQLLERERSARASSTGTVKPKPEPKPTPEPETTPEQEAFTMASPSFLTPTTRTKRVIVEERTNTLDLTIHDLTRLIAAGGVRVSPKKVKVRDPAGVEVTFPLRLEWTESTEREETDSE